MKQKKKRNVLKICIVVAIILVFLYFTCEFVLKYLTLTYQKEIFNQIEPYPLAKKWGCGAMTAWPEKPSYGCMYNVSASPEDILYFYEIQLNSTGWVLRFKHGKSGLDEQGCLYFNRDEYEAIISVRGEEQPYQLSVRVG